MQNNRKENKQFFKSDVNYHRDLPPLHFSSTGTQAHNSSARDLDPRSSSEFNSGVSAEVIINPFSGVAAVPSMIYCGSSPVASDRTATAGSDVVQSGRPIFDDFFQHLWPYIGNNTANVVFQMVKRLWLIRMDQ
ncbi:hypothetical protein TNCV_1409891 [Trichonephila clavipes]|uniref:Uncharacterized protein n=1 Tax=Trichonephila clavipes TaxID=2585209 RepID=A0A8X6UWL2_TRICX|nr:hypothetical protein TNCV_1409891 [Trichonephila clavipes]